MPSAFSILLEMLKAETVQFDWPVEPPLAEYVFQLSLAWLISLTLMAVGIYVFHRKRNIWIKVAALLASALAGAFCFLVGFSFTPVNHHRYGWNSNDRALIDWINWAVVLMIWGLSSLLFWAVRKIAKRGIKQTESNAN